MAGFSTKFALGFMGGLLALMMIVSISTFAQSITVLATVDGTPISNIDFEDRRNFLIKTTGIDYNDSTKGRIDSDVLQMLIDDIIKINAASTFGDDLEAQARQRASDLVSEFFSQNGGNPDEVLAALGISRQVAEKKFLADVLWASTIQARFSRQLSKVEDEAKEELERLKKNVQKPHADLDEIILVPGPNRDYTATRALGEEIFNALRGGADFSRIAQQYSASGSGQQGGRLGWVLLERLEPETREIISTAPVGAFTRPIDRDGTITLYRINALRLEGQSDPLQSHVDIYRLIYPADMTDDAAVQQGRKTVQQDSDAVANCEELAQLHDRYGANYDVDLGTFRTGDLAPQLREVIVRLEINEKSEIINFADGLVVFMVCDRINPTITLPSLQEIEASIRNKHYTALSSRYLSRLRKQAIISYKDGE